MKIKLPYDKGHLNIDIEDTRLKGVLTSQAHKVKADVSENQLVLDALANPIASKRLCDIAQGAENVLVITSDHTRPVPSKITLPLILEEIRLKNKEVNIKILIATGAHRPTSKEEMYSKFGTQITDNEIILNHDSTNEADMVYKGMLPSKGELWVNRLADWADVIVAEGFIEPHFFAGFSGGRKSILPGIASVKTVMSNHCAKFIASEYARTGNLDNNPIHKDMVFAAKTCGLDFIFNVALDTNKKIIKAFAGDVEKAHVQGCNYVKQLSVIEAVPADIVITTNSGYPLDQNIYQSVKGMTAAEPCVREGGVIIIAAGCCDGHGGEEYYKWLAEAKNPEDLYDKILSIPQEETIRDQWQAQIHARVLKKAVVIVVANNKVKHLIENMMMKYASSIEDAMAMAEKIVGEDSSVVVIPDGVGVILD